MYKRNTFISPNSQSSSQLQRELSLEQVIKLVMQFAV